MILEFILLSVFLAGVFILAFVAVFVVLWLLPGILASRKKHPDAWAIWLVTIFLGWSALGWVVALVWAVAFPAKVATLDKQSF